MLGASLVLLVRPPERRTGFYALDGHRVFRIRAGAVRGVDVVLGTRRFSAERSPAGWRLDGRAASGLEADALDDLVETVAMLRAVDVFRPRDRATFGLDRPRAVVTVRTAHRVRRVTLGAPNAAGSAFYARRDADPRVMQVGAALLSGLERVFFTRDGQRARRHAPEIG